MIDPLPAGDIASAISGIAPLVLSASVFQVGIELSVFTMFFGLAELHLPNPLINGFMADEALHLLLSLNRYELRTPSIIDQLRFDVRDVLLLEPSMLVFAAMPMLSPLLSKSAVIARC